MRVCIKCNLQKEDNLFPKKGNSCTGCVKLYRKEYYLKNKSKKQHYYNKNKGKILQDNKIKYSKNRKIALEKAKIYRENNSEIIKDRKKTYYIKNKIKILKKNKEKYNKNPERILKINKKWAVKNKCDLRKSRNNYHSKRIKEDPVYRLRKITSASIFKHLKKNKGSKNKKSILNFLDYSIEELKDHLESKFEPWMNWDNWGVYDPKTWDDNDKLTWTWQVDHIIPHSSFKYDSLSHKDFKKCWELSNLRPYSAKKNVIENSRRKK